MLTEANVWGVVPDGFRTIDDGSGIRLIVREDRLNDIDPSICRDGAGTHDSHYHGRGLLRAARLHDGETALIRRYRHGGFFRNLMGTWYVTWPPRPFRELVITEELRRRGFHTVEVYAAAIERGRGPLYRGWLVTRELRGAKDLWSAVQDSTLHADNLHVLLKAAAQTVRAMHRHGIYHADLNLKNILVRSHNGRAEGYVIDFDRAKLFMGHLPVPLARKNLKRLLRSALKLDPERRYLNSSAWNQFLKSYDDGAND